jgi:gentisate 1,2-dioxygenase
MTEPTTSVFHDQTGAPAPELDFWEPVVIPREAIEAEVERLASLERPADGRRRSLIVHPRAQAPGLGLAPGIQVSLDVLLPGERTRPIRHNASTVSFCIRGSGAVDVEGRHITFGRHDAWVTPSMATYTYENVSDGVSVRLTYSNAALLEKLHVHHVEDGVDAETDGDAAAAAAGVPGDGRDPEEEGGVTPPEIVEVGDGTLLMSYERLINPPVIDSPTLHWSWSTVKEELDKLHALGGRYRGRRLYLLFNPATGRTNGTTMNLFATLCLRPAKIVDRPHRHVAAAINYYFSGGGHSIVAGKRYDWRAGDLMLSAPGWAVHNHASHDEPVYELTIQDSPLHLAMDSLLWQEDLRLPKRLLGSSEGFATNRAVLEVR